MQGIRIKKHIKMEIPDSLVIPFNIVMRERGFKNAMSYVLYLISKDVNEYINSHPRIQLLIKKAEKEYREKLARTGEKK